MVDVELLLALMNEKKASKGTASKLLCIDRATFYRRIQQNGENITVGEARRLIEAFR